jgi:hypothetical protein
MQYIFKYAPNTTYIQLKYNYYTQPVIHGYILVCTHIIMSIICSIHNCGPLMPKICIIHLEYP